MAVQPRNNVAYTLNALGHMLFYIAAYQFIDESNNIYHYAKDYYEREHNKNTYDYSNDHQ